MTGTKARHRAVKRHPGLAMTDKAEQLLGVRGGAIGVRVYPLRLGLPLRHECVAQPSGNHAPTVPAVPLGAQTEEVSQSLEELQRVRLRHVMKQVVGHIAVAQGI